MIIIKIIRILKDITKVLKNNKWYNVNIQIIIFYSCFNVRKYLSFEKISKRNIISFYEGPCF